MKLAISKEQEITAINDFLRECSWLSNEFKRSDFEDMNWEDFEVLNKFDTKDHETFLKDLVRKAKGLFWEKAIFNLQTLLENCADKTLDHLDFNTEIKRGFEAVELLKTISEVLNPDLEIKEFLPTINELLTKEKFE